MTGDFRNVPPAESGAGGSDLCWERNESLQGHTVAMRPAWANASVLRVNLFSGETLSSPGHGLALQQLVQRCGHGTAGGWLWLGLGAEGFHLLNEGIPLHSINVCCRECLWHSCWRPGQPSFYEGGSSPDCLIHFLFSVSLRCLQTQERHGKEQRKADRWQWSERGCRQSRKLLSVLTFGQQKGKTSRVLGRGRRRSSDQCRDRSAGE